MANNNIMVSVIIVTYYHEDYIKKAIESVLVQRTKFNYEILISDDASKDRTLEIAKMLKETHGDLIKIHCNDPNVGTTRNLYEAFLRAKGKYITILAGDDVYSDVDKLSKQFNFLENHPEHFAAAVTTRSVYTDGTPTGVTSPDKKYRGNDFSQTDFAKGNNYPIHGIMFRNLFDRKDVRDKFHIVVDFSKYIEDLTLCLLFFEFGKVHILNDIAYEITTRRETDTNQHNFNSIFDFCKAAIMHVELIKKLQNYFGDKIDLSNRLCEPSWDIARAAIKTCNFKYLRYLKGVPLVCICKGARHWMAKKIKKA